MKRIEPEFIEMSKWGRDHWSLLAYIEAMCVDGTDGVGTIDFRKVRVNPIRHPKLSGKPMVTARTWQGSYGTQRGGKALPTHDDIDCLADLRRANLVDVIDLQEGSVRLTARGKDYALALRRHKLEAKATFGNYDPTAWGLGYIEKAMY